MIFNAKSLSHVRQLGTSWTVVHQTPLSMGFPRQEYWSGLPFPSHFLDPEIDWQVDSLSTELLGKLH